MGVRKLNLPKILAWVTLAAGLAVALFGHFATRYTQRSQAFEKNDCVFSYAQVHAYFTIPPTIVLWLLNRPFQCQLYRAKLVLLPTIAFVWTTPWDNELVRQRAWRYPRSCVLGTVGFVPIEEYFFFIIQSVMATLWTNFLTRWMLPTADLFETAGTQKGLTKWLLRPSTLAVLCCAAAFVSGLLAASPGQHSYYLGMISWWCSVPLALLGWGSANFIARCVRRTTGCLAFVLALFAPTIYLWAVDLFALRRGIWHINEATSLNIFPAQDLPIEEMVFFFVTNLLLVVASFTFDRCIALARLGIGVAAYTEGSQPKAAGAARRPIPFSPSYLPLDVGTILSLWQTFIFADPKVTTGSGGADVSLSGQLSDLEASLSIIAEASKSFSLASLLFPWDLRTDLCILYGFCRAADDCIDDEPPDTANADSFSDNPKRHRAAAKELRMQLLLALVDAIHRESVTDDEARHDIRQILDEAGRQDGLWLGPEAREKLRASASAVVSLRHLVPRYLWDELLRGYARDLELDIKGEKARFKSMDDLVEYAQCVAGCVGEMCVRVVLGRCGDEEIPDFEALGISRSIKWDKNPRGQLEPIPEEAPASCHNDAYARSRHLIHHARRMGVALQLVNIARDIVDDSIKFRRCYLPEELLISRGFSRKDGEQLQADLFLGRIYLKGVDRSAKNSKETSGGSTSEGVSPMTVRPFVLELTRIAASLYESSLPALRTSTGLKSSPGKGVAVDSEPLGISSRPTRSGLRAACSVYFALAASIENQSEDDVARGRRARLTPWKRLLVALKAVYFGQSS